MKQGVSPVVAGVIIAVVVLIAAFVLWKGTSGGAGSKPPGAVGNAGPFDPGGAAAGQGGRPMQAAPRTGPPAGIGMPGGASGAPSGQ